MEEIQLVGYTADLAHLVFCDAAQGQSRFRAPVDADLLATLTELVQLIEPDHEGYRLPGSAPSTPAPASSPAAGSTPSQRTVPPGAADVRGAVPIGSGPLAAVGVLLAAARDGKAADGQEAAAAPPARPRDSRLSPREIQALLRAGKSVRTVAKLADTDEHWVRRWEAPIRAEREQVLVGVRQARVAKSRLGPSADLVGDAVVRNLQAKGLSPDEDAEWTVSRRERDDFWSVALTYRSRGRQQKAVWRYYPEVRRLEPRNDLAVDVAWTRASGRRASGGEAPAATRRADAKKATAKEATAQAATGKAAPRKATAGEATAGKATAGKAAAKKATAQAATGKAAPRKATAGKATAGKAAAKKATAQAATGKAAPRKATAGKATAGKAALKKAAPKKAAPKRAAPKRAAAKKAAAKEAAPRAADAATTRPRAT